MRVTHFALLLPMYLACFVGGCQKSEEDRTLIGTNEQNKHLRERVTELEAELKRTKAEALAARATAQGDFETRLNRVQELNRQQLANLQGTIAAQRLELSVVRREKLVLQEIVDDRPLGDRAAEARLGGERAAWCAILLASLVSLLLVTNRLSAARDRLAQAVVRRASVISFEPQPRA